MKGHQFTDAIFHNPKQEMTFVYMTGQRVTCTYKQLEFSTGIRSVEILKATMGRCLAVKLLDNSTHTIQVEQPLTLVKDQRFLAARELGTTFSEFRDFFKTKRKKRRR